MELNEELKSTKTDLKSIEDKYVAEIYVFSSVEELCIYFHIPSAQAYWHTITYKRCLFYVFSMYN